MKILKRLSLLSLSFCLVQAGMAQSGADEFEEFLKTLLGPAQPVQAPRGRRAPQKPFQPARPIQSTPTTPPAKKAKTVETIKHLGELRSEINELFNALKDHRFLDQKFREELLEEPGAMGPLAMPKKMLPYQQPMAPSQKPKEEGKEKKQEVPLAKGFAGLNVELGRLLNPEIQRFYGEVFVDDKHASLRKEIEQALNTIRILTEQHELMRNRFLQEIKEKRQILESKTGRKYPTDEDVKNAVLLEQREPDKTKRLVSPFSKTYEVPGLFPGARMRKSKAQLQNEIKIFWSKTIPALTKSLQSFTKETQSIIEKKIAEATPKVQPVQPGAPYRDYRDYPGRYPGGYDEGYPYAPGRDRDYGSPYGSDRGRTPYDYRTPDQRRYPETTAPKDDKKGGYYGRPSKKEKKDEIDKTGITDLMLKVTEYLKAIRGSIPKQKTAFDPETGQALLNNFNNLEYVYEAMSSIKKREGTKEVTKAQKAANWKQVETNYHEAFVLAEEALLNMSKYADVAITENPQTGRQQLSFPQKATDAQKLALGICQKARTQKFFPKEITKKILDQEARALRAIQTVVVEKIKEALLALATLHGQRTYFVERSMYSIHPDRELAATAENLKLLLKALTVANKPPFKITLNQEALDIQQTADAKGTMLHDIEGFAYGKFSERFHIELMADQEELQRSIRETEQTFEAIKNALSQARIQQDPQEFLFAYFSGQPPQLPPAVEQSIINELNRITPTGTTRGEYAAAQLFIKNFNLLDEIQVLMKGIRAEFAQQGVITIPPQPTHKVEIIDAIKYTDHPAGTTPSGFFFIKQREVDIFTGAWKEIVGEQVDARIQQHAQQPAPARGVPPQPLVLIPANGLDTGRNINGHRAGRALPRQPGADDKLVVYFKYKGIEWEQKIDGANNVVLDPNLATPLTNPIIQLRKQIKELLSQAMSLNEQLASLPPGVGPDRTRITNELRNLQAQLRGTQQQLQNAIQAERQRLQ